MYINCVNVVGRNAQKKKPTVAEFLDTTQIFIPNFLHLQAYWTSINVIYTTLH